MPKVSVIIPVYNVEKYLAECLNSVCGQTLRSLEIICVNDGSTDGSAEILAKYKQKDKRLKVITQKNKGQSAARNAGLSTASGQYLYFMDSDDVLKSDALTILTKKSDRGKLDVLYFDATVIFADQKTAKKRWWYADFYRRRKEYRGVTAGQKLFASMKNNGEYRVQPCLQLIRRRYWQRLNLFFYEGVFLEDNLFNFLCMLQAGRVSHLQQELFIRRVNEGSTMTRPKTFQHFYGAFHALVQMLGFAIKRNINEPAVLQEITDCLNAAVSIYDLLPAVEKNKASGLPPLESYFFAILVQHGGQKWQRYKNKCVRCCKDFVKSLLG
ncbi:MAG: glycosyltransferase [Candidatus Margulisbacteria bacterium]|jgi:glycosyltransferase involved in cell wall biosynthesis|nr:glycosyltransferase [Candidatus Margulisiibacteriota bacterium]